MNRMTHISVLQVKFDIKSLLFLFGILFCQITFSQQTTFNEIEGIVINSVTNEPVPYVKVYNKAIKKGTLTNSEGYFRIAISTFSDSIILTHIGFKKEIIPMLEDRDNYSVYLNENVQELGEVIIRASDNSYLFEIIHKCKKNSSSSIANAKAYYELKSFKDTSQIELVEGFYNLGITGYDIAELRLKAGRFALQPYKNRLFTSQASSRALTLLKLTNSRDYFPGSPFNLNKREAKKKYYLYLESKYVDDKKDSIYILRFQPKDSSGFFFEGKVWINISEYAVEKINLNSANCKIHPFLPLFPTDSISNVSLSITKTFTPVKGKMAFNHIDFSYAVEYKSRTGKAEELNYSINTNAVLYAYDFANTFDLPNFDFLENIDDYRKINAFPYNSFFWDNNDEFRLKDAKNENEKFFLDEESVTNVTLFNSRKISSLTTDLTQLPDSKRVENNRGYLEHPYIKWSGNRILMREMIADSTTFENFGNFKSQLYNLEVKIFSDYTIYQDSTHILTATIFDPYTSFYYLTMDKFANCFINMYFDLCEIERLKLEKELKAKNLNFDRYIELINRSSIRLEKQKAIFFKEVERGTLQKPMEKWNSYIKEQLGIDNISLFKLYTNE